MRTDLLHLPYIVTALVAALPSQNATVPASMAGVEGGSSSGVPFGSNLACRYQCIFNAIELPWTGPHQIHGISLRADNGTPLVVGAAIAAKQYLDVNVVVSTTYATAETASSTFADNYGEDVTMALGYARIALPAQPVTTAPGPRAANIDLMFPTPWFYGLTPARSGQAPPTNLLIEIQVTSQPSGAYRLDNIGSCLAPTQTFGNQGPACTVPGAAGQPTLRSDLSMQGGSSFSWILENGPANAPYLTAFNLTNQGGLSGNPLLPLPFPLFDPTNPNLPPPGFPALHWSAPDCWLNIDPLVTLFGLCDATGSGVFTATLPAGRQFVGVTMFSQAIVFAQTANPLQIVTSNGHGSSICGPLGVARVYQFYNGTGTPPPALPTAGSVQYGWGLILEVH